MARQRLNLLRFFTAEKSPRLSRALHRDALKITQLCNFIKYRVGRTFLNLDLSLQTESCRKMKRLKAKFEIRVLKKSTVGTF